METGENYHDEYKNAFSLRKSFHFGHSSTLWQPATKCYSSMFSFIGWSHIADFGERRSITECLVTAWTVWYSGKPTFSNHYYSEVQVVPYAMPIYLTLQTNEFCENASSLEQRPVEEWTVSNFHCHNVFVSKSLSFLSSFFTTNIITLLKKLKFSLKVKKDVQK